MIVNEDVEVFRSNTDKRLTQIKTLSSAFNTPAVFNLYKNKTAILLWSKNPIGILIENNEITNSFKQYFNVLWQIAK